jgi:hypothetical protein
MDRMLCKSTKDITIMCEMNAYRLITQKKAKPELSLFELAVDFENWQNHIKQIETKWNE